MANLTAAKLRKRWPGKDVVVSDGGVRGEGRLVAIVRASGVEFRYKHLDARGVKRYHAIGRWSEQPREDRVTLAEARAKVRELVNLVRSGVGDLAEHARREREAGERARIEAERAKVESAARSTRHTLRELCEGYADHLERLKKVSARAVRLALRRNVLDAAPDLADRRAADIEPEAIVTLIRRLVEDDKGREAAKVRAYLHSAYGLALRSKLNPSAPSSLADFCVKMNPITGIDALSEFNNPREVKLSGPELGAFLRRLVKVEGVERDLVELALVLGGQRLAQTVRITRRDIDFDAGTVTLWDAKGRRRKPRKHELPLTERAAEILRRRADAMRPEVDQVFGLLRPEQASRVVGRIVEAMIEAKERREPFEARDLRRTAETVLAALGISSDVRAQIQSHGLGGVQYQHYNKHDYANEKRTTLVMWGEHLDALTAGRSAKVLPLIKSAKV